MKTHSNFIAVAVVMLVAAGCSGPERIVEPPPPSNPAPAPVPPSPEPTTGRVVFWTDVPGVLPIEVAIDGRPVGSISSALAGVPSCDQAGALTVTARAGAVNIVGSSKTTNVRWEGPMEVRGGECTPWRLYVDKPLVTLIVAGAGSGSGVVRSVSGAIDCTIINGAASGNGCTATRIAGATFELRAEPAAGSEFVGWRDGCSGTAQPCDLLVDRNRTLIAEFRNRSAPPPAPPAPRTYRLTVQLTGVGGGRVASTTPAGILCFKDLNSAANYAGPGGSCSMTVPANAQVTLDAAVTNSLSRFAGWSGDGCPGVVTRCGMAMDRDRVVTAVFGQASSPTPPPTPPPAPTPPAPPPPTTPPSPPSSNTCISGPTSGNPAYQCIGSYKGVDFYWRTTKVLSSSEAIMRIINTTGVTKEYSITPTFTCSDGSRRTYGSEGGTLGPGKMASGEFSGHWWFPCKDNVTITRINLTFTVKP